MKSGKVRDIKFGFQFILDRAQTSIKLLFLCDCPKALISYVQRLEAQKNVGLQVPFGHSSRNFLTDFPSL